MKNILFPSSLAACALVGLLAGCNQVSPSAQTQIRIQEKRDAFNALKPQQQENVLGGAIERGNSTDVVYMALGKPQKVVTSANGQKAMWVYEEYYMANGPAKFGFDDHRASYTSQLTSPNTPMPDSFLLNPGLKAVVPSSFSGTTGPLSQTLSTPDMQCKTIYVFFYDGKVAEIKLDGDSSDQKTVAANTVSKHGS